jgi:ADP-ribose pyrophosphatase YjhB (NUDIX family)
MDPAWLDRAKRLQALAQSGLAFTRDPYDRERYEAIRAIAAEMIAVGTGGDPGHIEALLGMQSGYATPKADVRAAVIREGRILMVKERSDGGWTLPGGWADVGDSPRQAVEREALEESGFEVRAVKLAAVYDRNRHGHTPHLFHIWKLFFLCELVGGAAKPSIETEAVDFFAPDALPPLSLGRVTAAQIAHMFDHHREPGRPTTFE